MNCIIIDDEATARAILNQLCSEIPYLNIVGEFENVVEAIKYLKNNQVDLILLDIHLPDFSGFELIDSILKFSFLNTLVKTPNIILTTSDKDFAIEAFEYNCIIDYLVKPILSSRFEKAIDKLRSINKSDFEYTSSIPKDTENEIYINIDRRLIKIKIKSICFIEAKGDYIMLKTDNERFIVHSSLKKIYEKLPSQLFLKLHRSFVVNIDKIKGIEDNTVLIDKDVIPLSRNGRTELISRINLL